MFYEVKLKVNRPAEDGEVKVCKEHYLLKNCEMFSDAEEKALSMYNHQGANTDVFAISRSKIIEVVNDNCSEEKDISIYKATIIKTYVEDNGKEKDMRYQVLLYATSVDDANNIIRDYMKQGLEDMKLVGIVKTKILDVV